MEVVQLQYTERIADALAHAKNDEAPVQIIKDGKTYLIPLGKLRGADYLRLPTGSTIRLAGTVIHRNDSGAVPVRKLVFFLWSFVGNVPFGAKVANAHLRLR